MQWDENTLKMMETLKILITKNASFSSRGFSFLPKRVLQWFGYPEPSLPANFEPKKLAILDVSFSSFTFDNQLIMLCIIPTYHEIYLVLHSINFQVKFKINSF